MANSVRIDLDYRHHDEGLRTKAFIEHSGNKLIIHVRRGNVLRLKAGRNDMRNLAKELIRLADAGSVACGEKSVAP